jgi:hypothetical protein
MLRTQVQFEKRCQVHTTEDPAAKDERLIRFFAESNRRDKQIQRGRLAGCIHLLPTGSKPYRWGRKTGSDGGVKDWFPERLTIR